MTLLLGLVPGYWDEGVRALRTTMSPRGMLAQ